MKFISLAVCVALLVASALCAAEEDSTSAAHAQKVQASANGSWTYRWGRGEPLCQALAARLNRYARDESNEARCSREVIASYADFKRPNWQELDAHDHQDIIAKMLMYQEQSFSSIESRARPASAYRQEAAELIQNGVRLRMLRTRLLGHFRTAAGALIAAPSTPQSVLQMYKPTNPEVQTSFCSGKPKRAVLNDYVLTFIFTDDLAEPDPRVDTATAFTLISHDVLLHNGKPILVGRQTVYEDGPLGLDGVCNFDFVQRKVGR